MNYTIFQSGMSYRFKGGKGGPKLPAQQTPLQRVEQDISAQTELGRQAIYRRYAKVRRATIMNEAWKPENRNQLGPG